VIGAVPVEIDEALTAGISNADNLANAVKNGVASSTKGILYQNPT